MFQALLGEFQAMIVTHIGLTVDAADDHARAAAAHRLGGTARGFGADALADAAAAVEQAPSDLKRVARLHDEAERLRRALAEGASFGRA